MLKRKIQAHEKIPYNSILCSDIIVGIDEVGRGSISGSMYLGYSIYKHSSQCMLPLECYHAIAHVLDDKNQRNYFSEVEGLQETTYQFYQNHDLRLIRDSKKVSDKNSVLLKILETLSRNSVFSQISLHYITVSPLSIDTYSLGVCHRHMMLYICERVRQTFPHKTITFLVDGHCALPVVRIESLLHAIQTHTKNTHEYMSSFYPFNVGTMIASEEEYDIYQKTDVCESDDITLFSCIKGDDRFLLIALISLYIKVIRDEEMNRLHEQYPYYQWNKNKGYATKQHIDAIEKYGASLDDFRHSFIASLVLNRAKKTNKLP